MSRSVSVALEFIALRLVGFEFVTNDLRQQLRLGSQRLGGRRRIQSGVGKPHRHRIALRRTGLPVPKTGFRATSRSADPCPTQINETAEGAILSVTFCAAVLSSAQPPGRGSR